jgi:hypothetical protein
MRPEIADLIRIPMYNELLDHSSVQNYPRVAGMFHTVYWMNHEIEEDSNSHADVQETSRSNSYEVEMVTQLVSYLSKQNCYKDGKVVVVTPYAGQVRKLMDSLGKTFTIQLSDEDKDEVVVFNPLEAIPEVTSNVISKPLTQSVRIATVKLLLTPSCNIDRLTISKVKKPILLLYLWFVRIRGELLDF